MKNARILVALLALGCLLPGVAGAAVDGYKHLKFGASRGGGRGANFCAMVQGNTMAPGVEIISCDDFPFGGARRTAGFFLVNGAFRRLIIALPEAMEAELLDSLALKYGAPEATPPSGSAVPSPVGMVLLAAFSDATVLVYRKPSGSLLLAYTAAGYEQYFPLAEPGTPRKLLDDL